MNHREGTGHGTVRVVQSHTEILVLTLLHHYVRAPPLSYLQGTPFSDDVIKYQGHFPQSFPRLAGQQ